MRYSLADLSEHMFNRPVAISRHKAEIILGVIGPRLNIASLAVAGEDRVRPIAELQQLAAAEAVQMDVMPGDKDIARRDWETGAVIDPYEIWNGIAIIKVRGTLMPENGLNPVSGMTGYDGLAYKARYALADGSVKGVILDHDSGGGSVVDMVETATALRELAAAKPMRSIVRGCSASADYALACCANDITCAPYSWVGSIGALIAHADFSEAYKQDGIAVTLIASAPHKTDASSDLPLDPEVRARMQSDVDLVAQAFIAHVAECRGLSVDEITAQEARFYTGEDGLKLGLVDKIMPWDASMKEFAQAVNGGAARTVATAPGARILETNMTTTTTAPAADAPVLTQADLDAAVAKATTDTKAATEQAERDRVAGLQAIAGEGNQAALTKAIAEGTQPGAFAIALRKGEEAKAAEALAGAQADAAKPDLLPAKGPDQQPGAKVNRGQAYVAKKATK